MGDKDRRTGLDRRRESVDAVLYGRVYTAHDLAERAFFAAMDGAPGGPLEPSDEETVVVAHLNGVAEGLARALAVLGGDPVDEIRARAVREHRADVEILSAEELLREHGHPAYSPERLLRAP